MRLLANPPVVKLNAQHVYDIQAVTRDAFIYNPATTKSDPVKLRTYWPTATPLDKYAPLIGPTIEVHPGDAFKVNFVNNLDDAAKCDRGADHNVPKCFGYTNLHTHGLWVSPSGNSDNVLIEIDTQGGKKDFQFNIPPEHPAGTFWYHPHVHGSTAIQTASGMSGALIIRGNRKPTKTANGDIDTLLAPMMPKERILLFQQISYACRTPDNAVDWTCTKGPLPGTISGYDQLGGSKWKASGRFTSINGQNLPTFAGAAAGKTERWRMIDGGIANSLNVFVRAAKPGVTLPDQLTAEQGAKWVVENCTGDIVHQFAIASDGLTRSKIVDRGATKPSTLQPGYREDVLVTFPHEGSYCVIDTASPIGVGQTAEGRELLGIVQVAKGHDVADQGAYLVDELSKAADKAYSDPEVRQMVRADLINGMRLSHFTPHKDLRGLKPDGTQTLAFNMEDGFEIGKKLDGSDAIPYNGKVSRELALGTMDEWTLTSVNGNHPYHIHVNPFQIVSIKDPNGKEVSETGEADDPQYADLQGEWKDTIFVKDGYHVVIRTRYERFDGAFVLHCHILDHEDKGMMEKVQICKTKDGKQDCPKLADEMPGMH